MAHINDILSQRNQKAQTAALMKLAESKSTVNVTPTVQWPDNATVTVKNPTEAVEITNLGDVLKSLALLGKGVQQAVDAVRSLDLTIPDKTVQEVSGYVETNISTKETERRLGEVLDALRDVRKELKNLPKDTKIEFPKLDIPKTVTVDNLSKLDAGLKSVNDNIVKLADVVRESKTEVEMPEHDNGAVIDAVNAVQAAIAGLVFPIPPGSTPSFRDTSGNAASATLEADGSVPVTIVAGGTSGTGNGAILDGVDATIKASVLNYTAAKPLAVRLTDTDGNYVGAGAGTQYADGTARGTATGTLLMGDDGTNIQSVKVDAAGELQVDVLSSTLPTGAATAANQATVIGHLDGVEGILTTIDADTGNISTKIDTIAGAVSGTEVQVDVLTMPTTTVQATNLDIRDLVSTADSVALKSSDGTRELDIVAGGDAGGQRGVAIWGNDGTLMKQLSTNTSGHLNIADGGNAITVDATDLDVRNLVAASDAVTVHGDVGALDQLDLTNSNPAAVAIVDGDGTQITSFGGGTQYTEDAAAAANPVGTAVNLIRQDTLAGLTSADGDNVAARGTDKGELYVKHVDAIPVTDNGGTLTVDGTVAATQSGTWNVTNISGTVSLPTGAATETTLAALNTKVTAVNTGAVVLAAGTAAFGKLAANSGVDIGDVDVTSLPALAAGTNAIGKLLPPDVDVTAHTNYARKYYTSTGAVTDGIVWSPAAGKRWHVCFLYINVSAAATVTLEDDKAGGDEVVWKGELAANSGIAIPFPEKYPLASGEDAADLLVTTSAGNVYITVVGYEI